MPANEKHRDYSENIKQWELTRDCVDGSTAVKKKKTKYLPKPNPTDNSTENQARYNAYVARANYVNFTGSTLDGMLGMVFRKDIQLDLQDSIEYVKENVNGGGLTLDQSARKIVSDVLQTGRIGLLVDYPEAQETKTKADEIEQNLRANVLLYPAESCINWRVEKVGAIDKLTMVVLTESVEVVMDDGFQVEEQEWYRVLRLENGIYTVEMLNEDFNTVSVSVPTNAKGNPWDEIPFIFCGAKNNDPDVDKAPLYDIAEINLAHYRNSADFEESCFMVGQPTPVLSGLTQTWYDKIQKTGINFGSRTAICLPEGGSGELLQASPNQMPEQGMLNKEKQMVNIGARIIQDTTGVETAEAAKIRFAGQNSKLGTVVGNVQSALLQCMGWVMSFMGTDGDNELELNTAFYDATIDPQLIQAEIMLMDRGVIAKKDLRTEMRQHGIIEDDRTDDDIDNEAEEIDPVDNGNNL